MLNGYTIKLSQVLDAILDYFPGDSAKKPLFLINLDDTDIVFARNGTLWMRRLLGFLTGTITKGYALFVVLSGTNAAALYKSFNVSSAKYDIIPLSLLEPRHTKMIILALANRSLPVSCIHYAL